MVCMKAPRPTTRSSLIADTDIQRGDLFQLGDHRLLCGDATNEDDVTRVVGTDKPIIMITDPPYGVAYDPMWRVRAGGGGRHAAGKVTNDDRVDWSAAFRLFPGDIAYVWHAGLHAGEVATSLTESGFELRAQIIWAEDELRARPRRLPLAARAVLVCGARRQILPLVRRPHAGDRLVRSEFEPV